jgi:hypothetical protein
MKTEKPNITMVLNGWVLGIITFCLVIILVYLIWKNWKDEKAVIQSFNEEIKPEMHAKDDEVI